MADQNKLAAVIVHKSLNYVKANITGMGRYEEGEQYSQEILIDYSVKFIVRETRWKSDPSTYNNIFCAKFINCSTVQEDKMIRLSSQRLKIKERQFISSNNEDSWHVLARNTDTVFYKIINVTNMPSFDITIHTSFAQINLLADLHEDEELMDFTLTAKDGSIKMHKLLLAAISPVFKTLLGAGEWKDAKEGGVDIEDVSRKHLEAFKTYVYKQSLASVNQEDLKVLLKFASRYEITGLEAKCVNNMMSELTNVNVYETLKLGMASDYYGLTFQILDNIRDGSFNLNELSKPYLKALPSENKDDALEEKVPEKPIERPNSFKMPKETFGNFLPKPSHSSILPPGHFYSFSTS